MKVLKITQGTTQKIIGGTLPDIDTDFPSSSRGLIKSYIEKRFGETQVCSVGVFTTMKPKSILKDLGKAMGLDFSETNLISSILSGGYGGDENLLDIFKKCRTEPVLKRFLKENSDLFYMLPTLLDQPRNKSVHPCAMIVFPSVLQAKEWAPMRLQKGMVVSEWRGGELDDAGFLKDDILGILQLDKFQQILELVKERTGEVWDVFDLPHDPEVYRYFSNGWNGDTFQFASHGLTEYGKLLKPKTVEDLIAAIALFRPGPMDNGYHEDYVKRKNEGEEVKFLWGTEEITKETYGLLVYQEQIMQVCQLVGGLTLEESDDVRRSMGKRDITAIQGWKGKVHAGFMEKGCPSEEEFEKVWEAMLKFARYAFNKSHSACYGKTSYASQWLKVTYPLEYWTVALTHSDEEGGLKMLSEIFRAGKIKVFPPDINTSQLDMVSANESIYWGIGTVKGIGEKTAVQILEERKARGDYTSLTDFILRHSYKGSTVKKQTFEALISSGAFDALYHIQNREEMRNSLVKRFRLMKKVKPSNLKTDPYTIGTLHEQWWWLLKQKELIKLVQIDFSQIYNEVLESTTPYTTPRESEFKHQRGIFRGFAGYISKVVVRTSKRGPYARVTIESGNRTFIVIFWSDTYVNFKQDLKGAEKGILVFDGLLQYDATYSKANQFTIQENSTVKILKP